MGETRENEEKRGKLAEERKRVEGFVVDLF